MAAAALLYSSHAHDDPGTIFFCPISLGFFTPLVDSWTSEIHVKIYAIFLWFANYPLANKDNHRKSELLVGQSTISMGHFPVRKL